MVDLPSTPLTPITSEAPKSALTPGQIASPYQQLGAAMEKGGEGFDKVATSMAEQDGLKAVTRDADGNVQVQKAPYVGDAAIAYSRAVKFSALAQGEGDAKRGDMALRTEFRDNPAGYLKAADAFQAKLQKQYTDAAGPEVGIAMGKVVDGVTTQTYKGLLTEKERLDLQRADNTISAGITSASDDAIALARQGVSKDAPEMQALFGKYSALLDERTNNPRLAYTPAQRDLDVATFSGELEANRFLYHIDQTYKGGGYKAAVEDAKDILTNPGYKLPESKREAYYHRALGEVRANEAIRRQDIGEARSAFNELTMASATGARIDPDSVEQVASAFRAANDPGSAARVYASFARKPLNDDFGRQPIDQQTQQLNAIKGAQAAQSAYQFFIGKGYRPEEAAGIVGNLIHESGVNPSIMGDNGTSGGLAQFHNERLTALKQFAAAQGKPATDFNTQLEFIHHELQTSEAGTLGKLNGAKTAEEAAAAFIDYERPRGWTAENPAAGLGYQNRQALARTVFDGKPADGSGGVAASAWLTVNRQRAMDKELWSGWQTVMKDYSEKGVRPNDDALTQIMDGARATGNAALLETIGHDMARIELAQGQGEQPLAQQHVDITALTAAGASGNLSPGQGALLKDLQTRYAAITKGLEDNPISTAVSNFPDKFKTPPPLDFSDPQKLVGGLKMRAQIAQTAAANWQTGPLPALDKQDVAQVKALLANPDPAVKAGLYGAIATLPEDVRGATLKKLGGNQLTDIAEASAGSMMATDPQMASSIIRGLGTIGKEGKSEFLPSGTGAVTSWREKMAAEFPATAFSLAGRTNPTGDYAATELMIKGRYAFLAAQTGDTSGKLDEGRLKHAVADVTGGILHQNGGGFIAPTRGMTQPQFDLVLAGVTDNDLAGVSTLSGKPVSAEYLRDSAQLESVGHGQYLVRLGKDPSNPIYAFQRARPFVLDLRGRAPPATTNLSGMQALTAGNLGGYGAD